MTSRILLVEDDESLGFVVRDNLIHRGYQVSLCPDGPSGFAMFSQETFDLCILDVMLPKMDGFELAENIRQNDQSIPILFLTAKSMQEDKILGFQAGGDDYIVKPFSMDELVYRIEVFLKRREINGTIQDVHQIGSISIDPIQMGIIHGGILIKLTRRELELLQFLTNRQNQIVKREDILKALWGDDDYFKGRSLDVFISKLRKCLKIDPTIDIENYHGVGFKLVVH